MDNPLNSTESSLIKILVTLNRERKTGTLTLKTLTATKNIYINQGDAIFASSTFPDDRLGEMLLKAGKINVEQYDKSVEILKATKKRQGAILVELGYLTPKALFWGVKYQVKEIIYSMFEIDNGEYEFIEGEIPLDEVITLRMSMGNLIYEGSKRIKNWTRIRTEMPDTDSVLKLSDDPFSLFQDIELSPQDKKILGLVDGARTIKEIIEHSWMGSFEALKILYVLWSTGIVELTSAFPAEKAADAKMHEVAEEMISLDNILQPSTEGEDALLKRVEDIYARLGNLSLYELLDAEKNTDNATLKKNYYRLSKEFHPDRYFTFADADIKPKLTAIFDAITHAYNTLKGESLGEECDTPPDTPKTEAMADEKEKAKDHYKKGIDEFKKGNFWGAIESFTSATKLMPKTANYWSYLSLAYSKIPGKSKEAEDSLLAAIKLEPLKADHYANIGYLYIKVGLKKRALSNFQKALKIDAKNMKAIKGMKQLKGLYMNQSMDP